jgi:hypothetical protein
MMLHSLGAEASTTSDDTTSWADSFVRHRIFNAVMTLVIFGVPIALLTMLFFFTFVSVLAIAVVLLFVFYHVLKVIGTRWGHFEAVRVIEEVTRGTAPAAAGRNKSEVSIGGTVNGSEDDKKTK